MLCEVPIQTDVVGGQVEMMIQCIRRPRLLMQSVPTNCLELSLILAIVFRVSDVQAVKRLRFRPYYY